MNEESLNLTDNLFDQLKAAETLRHPQRADAQTDNIFWKLPIKNGVSLTEKVQESVLALQPCTVIFLDSLFQGQDMVKTNAQLKMEDNGITFKTV